MHSGRFNLLAALDAESIALRSGRSRAESSRTSHSPGRSPAQARAGTSGENLLPLAGDPDPMVRFQLAFSLGEAND